VAITARIRSMAGIRITACDKARSHAGGREPVAFVMMCDVYKKGVGDKAQ
jgi:hypothetical protein